MYFIIRKNPLFFSNAEIFMINKSELSNLEFNAAIRLHQRCFEFEKEEHWMLLVNGFVDFSPWADSTETIFTVRYKSIFMQLSYSDQFVSLSIHPSLHPGSLIRSIASFPLAQSSLYLIHRLRLGKIIELTLNHVYRYR